MIVRLMGGLGNQMFQYAMGKMLSERRGEELYLDKFSYFRDRKRRCEVDCFHIKTKRISLFYSAYYNFLFYFRSNRKQDVKICYEAEAFKYQDLLDEDMRYFVGFWQNEAYFKEIRDALRREFTFREKFSPDIEKTAQRISAENSVAVHVRRGDYLDCADYAVVGTEYYKKAMHYVRERVSDTVFFVFSDDMEWCEKQFEDWDNVFCISGNTGKEDFYLMSKCRHFIIANSTFSWWAAWLSGENSVKTAPSQWFTDEKTNRKVKEALLEKFYVINDTDSPNAGKN